MVTTQGTIFETIDASGSISVDDESEDEMPALDFLKGSLKAHSYTNIGSKEFKALLFEFKK